MKVDAAVVEVTNSELRLRYLDLVKRAATMETTVDVPRGMPSTRFPQLNLKDLFTSHHVLRKDLPLSHLAMFDLWQFRFDSFHHMRDQDSSIPPRFVPLHR
jgi:hypothetical protein